MTRNVRIVRGALLAALVFTAACGDLAPTAPRAQPVGVDERNDLLGLVGGRGDGLIDGLLSKLSLFRCDSPDLGSVTQTVGPSGGVIHLGPHSLTIPRGALLTNVEITAKAKGRDHVKIDFQPHGLRFKKATTLRLSYAHCTNRPVFPKVVYVGEPKDGEALRILELLPALTDLSTNRVTASIGHFSGYAIAD